MGRVWAGTTFFCPNPYPNLFSIPTNFNIHGHKLVPMPIPIGYLIPNEYLMGTIYNIGMIKVRQEEGLKLKLGTQPSQSGSH